MPRQCFDMAMLRIVEVHDWKIAKSLKIVFPQKRNKNELMMKFLLNRCWMYWLMLVLLVIAGKCMAFADSKICSRPNIVVILADDMGWSDLGCYGSEIRTPAIDSLAAEGMLATRCYTIPRCSPSRAALMTGRYPQSVGMGHLDHDLGFPGYRGFVSKQVKLLPEILRTQAGYRTYMAGKWHLGRRRGECPWDRGFQRYFGLLSGANSYMGLDPGRMMADDGKLLHASDLPKNFYMTDAITEWALSYIDDAAGHRSEPFFLYVAYTAPHTPLMAKLETIQTCLSMYENVSFDDIQSRRLNQQKSLGIVPQDLEIPEKRRLHQQVSKEEQLRMAVYAAQIVDMDRGIGRILSKLREYQLDDQTIIIMLSDNGGTNENPTRSYSPYPGIHWERAGYGRNWATVSNTPWTGFKSGTYEGGMAIPCIVKYPGKIVPNTRFHGMMHMIDIAPSVLSWCGIQPQGMHGSDLTKFWVQYAQSQAIQSWVLPQMPGYPQRLLFTEHEGNRAVLTNTWKLRKKRNGDWKLYRIDDRLEMQDLSIDYQNLVDQLSKNYDSWAIENNVTESMKTYWRRST